MTRIRTLTFAEAKPQPRRLRRDTTVLLLRRSSVPLDLICFVLSCLVSPIGPDGHRHAPYLLGISDSE